ncbi:CPBP family intramembrane metalloprotease [Natrialba swarupiae]|nr:CPBP family intramembrane metalloprotease [Natrialba swarupiae]
MSSSCSFSLGTRRVWVAWIRSARLQEPHSAVVVAVLVGILWASWHLPLFLLYDLPAYDPATLHSYYLTTILWAIVLAWLYNSTGGGLLVVIIARSRQSSAVSRSYR